MRIKYSINNSITSFINNVITFIFLFIGETIFIKILGIEYAGLNGLFSNVLTVLNLFELGIGSSIVYNLYKYIKENDIETIKSIMCFFKKAYNYIAIFIFFLGLLLIPFLKYIVKVDADINIYIIYILFLINTVFTYLITYKRSLLIANQRSYVINIINILYVIILNILQVLIIYLTKNFYLYLAVKIVCTVIENIVINLKVNKDYPYMLDKNIKPLDKKVKDSIVDRVKALIIHKTSGVVTNGTDNILISMFLGIKMVGLYTSYNYIFTAVKKLFLNIISGASASVGNLLVEENYSKNYVVFKKINFLNLWISIFTSTCLLILTQPFIVLWLGRKYLLDEIVLVALVLNYFQTMMRYSYSIFKDAAGIWIEDKYMPILQLCINLFSSIILIKLIGLAGVFLGTVLSSFVLWFYSYPKFVYKKLLNKNVKDYIVNMAWDLTIFIAVISISYIINTFSTNIFISFVICLIVPNLLLFIIFHKTYEFDYYKKLFRKIRKKV